MIADELDLIEVGCSVFDFSPHADPDEVALGHGGIVWAITIEPDPDTGERCLRFHVAEPHRRGSQHVRFAEIQGSAVEQSHPPNSSSIRYLRTQCHLQIAEKGKRGGTDEVRALAVINALMETSL